MPDTPATASDTLLDYLNRPDVSIVARLAQSAIASEDDQVLLADIVECDFEGYEPVTEFDWEDVAEEGSTAGEVLSAPVEFAAGEGVAPQQAAAVYITLQEGDADPVLAQLAPFAKPITFDQAGQGFKHQVRVQTPSA